MCSVLAHSPGLNALRAFSVCSLLTPHSVSPTVSENCFIATGCIFCMVWLTLTCSSENPDLPNASAHTLSVFTTASQRWSFCGYSPLPHRIFSFLKKVVYQKGSQRQHNSVFLFFIVVVCCFSGGLLPSSPQETQRPHWQLSANWTVSSIQSFEDMMLPGPCGVGHYVGTSKDTRGTMWWCQKANPGQVHAGHQP